MSLGFTDVNTQTGSYRSTADLSAAANKVVGFASDDNLVVLADATAAPLGVLGSDPIDASGLGAGQYRMESVIVHGPAKAIAGGAIAMATVRVSVKATTAGKLAAGTAGDWCVGYLEEAAAADGDAVRIFVSPHMLDSDT
jgi:hypothetical protein